MYNYMEQVIVREYKMYNFQSMDFSSSFCCCCCCSSSSASSFLFVGEWGGKLFSS